VPTDTSEEAALDVPPGATITAETRGVRLYRAVGLLDIALAIVMFNGLVSLFAVDPHIPRGWALLGAFLSMLVLTVRRPLSFAATADGLEMEMRLGRNRVFRWPELRSIRLSCSVRSRIAEIETPLFESCVGAGATGENLELDRFVQTATGLAAAAGAKPRYGVRASTLWQRDLGPGERGLPEARVVSADRPTPQRD